MKYAGLLFLFFTISVVVADNVTISDYNFNSSFQDLNNRFDISNQRLYDLNYSISALRLIEISNHDTLVGVGNVVLANLKATEDNGKKLDTVHNDLTALNTEISNLQKSTSDGFIKEQSALVALTNAYSGGIVALKDAIDSSKVQDGAVGNTIIARLDNMTGQANSSSEKFNSKFDLILYALIAIACILVIYVLMMLYQGIPQGQKVFSKKRLPTFAEIERKYKNGE